MLNDLTPAEQRAIIEAFAEVCNHADGPQYFDPGMIQDLCRLALTALPVVEWDTGKGEVWKTSLVGRFQLVVWMTGRWTVNIKDIFGSFREVLWGESQVLEAAQAAAEAALLKLVRGE